MSASSLLEDLLARVAERIVASSPRWSPANCFAAETPFPLVAPTLDRFLTVAPGDGAFDESLRAGGVAVLRERVVIVATTFRQVVAGSGFSASVAPRESLLAEREALLATLLEPWEPTRGGRRLLVEPLVPLRSSAPAIHRAPQGGSYLGAGLAFEATLDRGAFLSS